MRSGLDLMIVAILSIVSIFRAKVSLYVESVCDFSNKNMRSQNYVLTTQNVDTKNPLKNYITLLIVNTYADEYYSSTAQKWKGPVLLEGSGTSDAWHTYILVARKGGKQDILKPLDIKVFQMTTYGNSSSLIVDNIF